MTWEKRKIDITMDEYGLIRQYRELETDEQLKVLGFIKGLVGGPWRDAVRRNKRLFPERFFVDATITDAPQEVAQ